MDLRPAQAALDPPAPAPPAPARSAELVAAGATVAALAAVGLVLAVLWWAVSPPVHLVITSAGPDLINYGSDEIFAVDGTFALLGAALGLVSAAVVWFAARRWRGPVLMAGLVLGSIACGLVAWQVGRQIGLSSYHSLLHSSEVGRRFSRPVDLRSKAALLPQPFLALAGYLVLAAWVARPDLGRSDDAG